MITKAHLLDSMLHECTVAQHLFGKLPAGSFDYRPTPGQRSTAELLQYLSVIGIAGATCLAERDWKRFGPFSERMKAQAPEGFVAAMDRQKQELTELFATLTDERLTTQDAPMPAGGTLPLAAAMMNGPIKWLTAYKLQLFLYAKACGASELATANAWRGSDPAPKPA